MNQRLIHQALPGIDDTLVDQYRTNGRFVELVNIKGVSVIQPVNFIVILAAFTTLISVGNEHVYRSLFQDRRGYCDHCSKHILTY